MLLGVLAIILLILGLGFGLTSSSQEGATDDGKDNVSGNATIGDKITDKSPQPPHHSQSQKPVLSSMGIYYKAAVASDGKPCAKIGS